MPEHMQGCWEDNLSDLSFQVFLVVWTHMSACKSVSRRRSGGEPFPMGCPPLAHFHNMTTSVQGGDGGWLLGWVDFDLGVPPDCPTDQPILPYFHLPKQVWADSGMSNYKVNPTQ